MKLRSEAQTPERSGLPSASFGAGPEGTALPLPLAFAVPSPSCAAAGEMVSNAIAAAPAIRMEPSSCLFTREPPRMTVSLWWRSVKRWGGPLVRAGRLRPAEADGGSALRSCALTLEWQDGRIEWAKEILKMDRQR